MERDLRRALLKKIGLSSAIGVGGIASVSGTGAAAIAADGDGSVSDSEWDSFESYAQDKNSGTSSQDIVGPGELLIPNPVELGFDVCATEPDGDQLCVSTFTLGEEQYQDCAGGTLSRWGFSVDHKLLQDGEFTVNWGINCWIGIDSNNCIWAGVNTAEEVLEECSRIVCPTYPDYYPVITDVKDQVWSISTDIVDWIRENGNGRPQEGTSSETALIAIAAFVVFIVIFAPPPGVPG